jgi:hypothetical protein
MPIHKTRSSLKAGTEFAKEFRGKTYRLKVVKSEGRVAYELGGAIYSSPSGAAKSLTKAEVNGWRFWKID